jgi:hypothetical protein
VAKCCQSHFKWKVLSSNPFTMKGLSISWKVHMFPWAMHPSSSSNLSSWAISDSLRQMGPVSQERWFPWGKWVRFIHVMQLFFYFLFICCIMWMKSYILMYESWIFLWQYMDEKLHNGWSVQNVATHCLPETTSWRKLLKDCLFFSSLLEKKMKTWAKKWALELWAEGNS